jgi:divalent metal cation (Fe/Co/Zn/Cd) transporter
VHDRELEAIEPRDLRAGVRVSVASMAWTIITSALALAVGLHDHSLVLISFGLTGILDAAGSATLVAHFRHALHHEAFSERHERRSLLVVTAGLAVVAAVTAAESTRRLIERAPSHAAPAGVVVAAASIVVLAVLSYRKGAIAARIPSPALAADGWLSATGCLLAVVTVAGTGLTSAYGWWWADPTAAIAIAIVAAILAVALARTQSRATAD